VASRGFIELLRLANLAKNRNSIQQGGQQVEWRGVVFEVAGQRLVAPMGEISEVLLLPDYTSIPLTQPWLLGIANVRGRLLPLTDLARFLHVPSKARPLHKRKVMVIDQPTIFVGLLVDQVLGIEQFTHSQYRAEAIETDSAFAPYNHGKFVKDQQDWFVFMPSLLLQDPRYIDAAI
jgi:twitching motility protein PilI